MKHLAIIFSSLTVLFFGLSSVAVAQQLQPESREKIRQQYIECETKLTTILNNYTLSDTARQGRLDAGRLRCEMDIERAIAKELQQTGQMTINKSELKALTQSFIREVHVIIRDLAQHGKGFLQGVQHVFRDFLYGQRPNKSAKPVGNTPQMT